MTEKFVRIYDISLESELFALNILKYITCCPVQHWAEISLI
jgi:hypothetical protein